MNRARYTWLLLACLSLAACGGASTATPANARVAATDFRFQPAALTLKAGQATEVVFKNDGQTLHDFTIVAGPGIEAPAGHAGDHMNDNRPNHIAAEAGAEAKLSLTLPAGSYTFICSVAGHKELGMSGTLTVQ